MSLLRICTSGLLVVFLAMWCSCEDRIIDADMTIEPSDTTITEDTDMGITLTATPNGDRDLYYPLVWEVSDPSLGEIQSSAGAEAVYKSFGVYGNNTITVHDQDQSSGAARVFCSIPGGGLVIAPNETTFTTNTPQAVVLVVTADLGNPVPPLHWSVGNSALGYIASHGGLSAVYESTGVNGINTVKVVDSQGNKGTAAVTTQVP